MSETLILFREEPSKQHGTDCFFKKVRFWSILILVLSLGIGIRFHNLTDVLVGGNFYFVDADCYSRMSRAKQVSESPGTVVRHQDFENWPEGVESHATAPMDYAIVALERVLRVAWPEIGRLASLKKSTLDLAGALVSPLLGMLLCGFLAAWSAGCGASSSSWRAAWWLVPFLAALSPPLVHATVFGRPDHQSLLLLFLAIALAAEQRLQAAPSNGWAWAGGCAWGAALWVSLYEPAVLLGVVLLLGIWPWRSSWTLARRSRWTLGLLALIGCGWFVDGIHFVLPDSQWKDALQRWGSTIGELQAHEDLGVFSAWTGFLVWIAPVWLLWQVRRQGRLVSGWLLLWLILAGLAFWQARWSPYFVLGFILCLPLIFSTVGSAVQIGCAFLLSLYPVFADWEQRCFPEASTVEQRYLERSERINARLAAEKMRSPERMPFLAVWWHSPALAYWSGQPAVAGSGHEGIAGIVDSARFFLATEPAVAHEILKRRNVRVVVASDSARAVENSATVLGQLPSEKPLAEKLWGADSTRVWGLDGETNVTTFRLLRVPQ